MKKRQLLSLLGCTVLLILIFFSFSEATNRKTYIGEIVFGARSLGLGGCSIMEKYDLETIYSNPAALALMSGDASFSISNNNQFGIQDWSEEKIAFALRQWGLIRLGFLRNSNKIKIHEETGVNLWNDTCTVSSLGIKLSDRMALGANYQRLNYTLEVEEELKSKKINLMNVGCIYSGENISWGLALHNWEVFNKKRQVEPSFHFGLGLHTDLIDYKVEISNYETAIFKLRKWSASVGLEVDFAPDFVVRIGSTALDKTANIAVGIGVSIKNVTIDYTYTTPYKIQASHHLSTTYHF